MVSSTSILSIVAQLVIVIGAQSRWHRHRDRDSTRFIDDRLRDSRLRRTHTDRYIRRFNTNQMTSSDGFNRRPDDQLNQPNFNELIGNRRPVSSMPDKLDTAPIVTFSSKKTQFWEKPSNALANSTDGDSLPGDNTKWRATYLDPDGDSPYLRLQTYGNLTSSTFSGPPNVQNVGQGGERKYAEPSSLGEMDGAADLTADEMEARFLNIFTVVRFNNTACNGSAGDNGTCYTANECARLGGVPSGSCALGFGVCCVFLKTCGQNTTANCTYFVNTNYPSTNNQPGSCQLVVNKCSPDVCQLRLDFITFVLGTPDANGVCSNDVFTVTTAAGSTTPSICGSNSGQSLYIDVPPSQLSAALVTVVTSGETNTNRAWKVKITQIPCNSLARAPSGCNQYYTGTTGQITTYNYNGGRGSQLANQDVTYCVRMDDGFCGIQYTVCPDTVNAVASSFSVSGLSNAKNSRTAQLCLTDWVTIPCASDTPYNSTLTTTGTVGVCPDRLCGNAFNPNTNQANDVPVYSFRKPFIITYHTDGSEPAAQDTNNRGFCLNYVQQPCLPNFG